MEASMQFRHLQADPTPRFFGVMQIKMIHIILEVPLAFHQSLVGQPLECVFIDVFRKCLDSVNHLFRTNLTRRIKCNGTDLLISQQNLKLMYFELILWMSELIPLYFGSLNLHSGCQN